MIINEDKLENCNPLICNLALLLEKRFGTIQINSGYRSEEHNRLVGGAKTSYHLSGKAIDVSVKDVSCLKLASYVLTEIPYINGFGIDVYKNYCHLDMREGDKVFWVYGKDGKIA